MDTSARSARRLRRIRRAGFSLIEIMLAIGIIAFAFIAIFGLIPGGLRIFRQAMDASVGSQIAQRVVSDAQQTDFDQLVTDENGNAITGVNSTGRKAVRYFDEQGTEIDATDAALVAKAIYHVNTRVTPATRLPKSGTSTGDNTNLATVTIQVAYNPGNQPLVLEGGAAGEQDKPMRNLWTGAFQRNTNDTAAAPILIYSTLVSKNK